MGVGYGAAVPNSRVIFNDLRYAIIVVDASAGVRHADYLISGQVRQIEPIRLHLTDDLGLGQVGQIGMGQGVYGHLVALVYRAYVLGIQLVMADALTVSCQCSAQPQKLRVEIKGSPQPVSVHHFYQMDVLCYAVVIAEGDGLLFILLLKLHTDLPWRFFLLYYKWREK